MSELQIQQAILAAIGSRPDLRVWRNATGALRDHTGRLIRFGLVGSADILGILKPAGRFLAIEVKDAKGRQRPEQIQFQTMIEAHGGLYVLARSVGDVLRALEEATR